MILLIQKNKIYNMDCLDLMLSMIEENFKIDGVITKPPKNLSCEDYISIFN